MFFSLISEGERNTATIAIAASALLATVTIIVAIITDIRSRKISFSTVAYLIALLLPVLLYKNCHWNIHFRKMECLVGLGSLDELALTIRLLINLSGFVLFLPILGYVISIIIAVQSSKVIWRYFSTKDSPEKKQVSKVKLVIAFILFFFTFLTLIFITGFVIFAKEFLDSEAKSVFNKESNRIYYNVDELRKMPEKKADTIEGLTLWLDVSSLDAQYNDGDTVCSWNDINPKKASKFNVTQKDTKLCPTYKKSGIGNLPSLQFNGNQYLLSDISEGGRVPLAAQENDFTYVVVWQINDKNCCSSIIDQSGKDPNLFTRAALVTGTDGYYLSYGFNGGSNYEGGRARSYSEELFVNRPAVSLMTVQIAPGEYHGGTPQSTKKRFFDNIKVYTDASAGGILTSGISEGDSKRLQAELFCIGAKCVDKSEKFNGLISEVIIFNRILEEPEIAGLMKFLGKKYNIRIDQPRR